MLFRALVVVTGLLLALGLAGRFYVKKIDGDYSRLVEKSIAGFKSLQEISRHSARSYAALATLPSAREPDVQSQLVALSDREIADNDKIFADLSAQTDRGELRSVLMTVKSARNEFHKIRKSYLELLRQGDVSGAQKMSTNAMQPAYLTYMEACGDFSATLEVQATSINSQITTETNRMRVLFLIVSTVPVIFAVSLSVLLFLFWFSMSRLQTKFDFCD